MARRLLALSHLDMARLSNMIDAHYASSVVAPDESDFASAWRRTIAHQAELWERVDTEARSVWGDDFSEPTLAGAPGV